MSKGKQNYSNACDVCGDGFDNFGEYVAHYKTDHQKSPWRNEELLKKLYVEKRLSSTEVGDRLGCASSTIIKWLKKHEIERRELSEALVGKTHTDYGVTEEQKEKLNDKAWLLENYVEGERSMGSIADELDCSRSTVSNALEHFEIEKRPANWEGYTPDPGENSDYPELYDADWVRREYIEEDKTLEQIAEKLGCSIPMISYAVNRFGLQKQMSEIIGGEDHPMYKGGRIDYGADWYRSRRKRLERDGYECVVCGMSDREHTQEYGASLHVHHIKPLRSFDDPNDGHVLSNLVTLCVSCHNRWEGIPLRPHH